MKWIHQLRRFNSRKLVNLTSKQISAWVMICVFLIDFILLIPLPSERWFFSTIWFILFRITTYFLLQISYTHPLFYCHSEWPDSKTMTKFNRQSQFTIAWWWFQKNIFSNFYPFQNFFSSSLLLLQFTVIYLPLHTHNVYGIVFTILSFILLFYSLCVSFARIQSQ